MFSVCLLNEFASLSFDLWCPFSIWYGFLSLNNAMLSGHLTAESDIYSISGPSLQASDVVPTMARDDSSLIRHRGLMEWNSGAFDFLPIPMTTSTRNSRLRRNPSRQYQSGHPVASHADNLELACGRWRRRRHERAPTRQPNKQNPKLLAARFRFRSALSLSRIFSSRLAIRHSRNAKRRVQSS
jgi:hypothetical protein